MKKGKKLIVVLGMHRSGTSVVTRGLQVMGVELGSNLMPPIGGNNERGFWEDLDIYALNVEMLNSLNTDWHFLTPIQPADVNELRRNGYFLRAVELLQKKTLGIEVFGFKDPRTAKLLSFWKEVFVKSRLKVSYIITIRNPLSVGLSLVKRDGLDLERSYLLWLEHMISSLLGTVGESCIVVDYDRLIQSPEEELTRIAKVLHLQVNLPKLEIFKTEFLDKDLRHTVFQPQELILDAAMYPLTQEVYSDVLNVALDKTQLTSATFKNKIARWNNEFSRQKSALMLADKLTLRLNSAEQALAERDHQLAERDRQLTEWKAQVQTLTTQLYEITRSKAWRVAMMLRQVRVFALTPVRVYLRIKSILLIFPKTLQFYKKNGLARTLLAIQNRLRFRIHKLYSYQYLISKFPQRFDTLNGRFRNPGAWKAAVDLSAQDALQNILTQLNLTVDAKEILTLIQINFGQNVYFHLIHNMFILDTFIAGSNGSKAYPLVQTSGLPEVSNTKVRRRILFVTSQFPNPQNGGGNRVLNFIKILSENNDIYLAACFIPEDDEEVLPVISPYCYSIHKIPLPRFGNNQAEIREWLNGAYMDVVHYEWPRSLENYDPAYGRYHIFTHMEAASLRMLMDINNLDLLSEAWQAKLIELVDTLRLELFEASQLDARIVVTTKDGEFFRALYPFQEYAVLNHGITFDEFSLPDIEPEPHTLIFVGNYQHYPNVAAMEYFFREIWSDVVRKVPDARIYVVGPKPPKEIEPFADGEKVIVTGGVTDIRSYIQKACVGIAPLITGAGMRGKVIDYAALRRTFVATSIATTDLLFRDGIDYMRADTSQEFAEKIVTLLKDGGRAKQMAIAAYETAKQNYDNRRLSDFLLRLYNYLEG